MDKDKKRLKSFDGYMKENNIKYERFSAVVGSKVKNDSRLTDFCNTFCTDGGKGCSLSHRTIWDSMIENNYKNVLVFEDDAVIDKNFDKHFQHVWNHLPQDYDIIYFGALFGGNDDSIANELYKKILDIPTEEMNEFIHTSNGTVGTHCYMISLEGAKKFATKQINSHIDSSILSWIKEYNYNAYVTSKNMVESSQDDSSLGDTYPILLNSVLRNFKMNNNKIPTTLDWALSENQNKLGNYNINNLIITLMIIVSFLPPKYYYIIFIWLLVELIISKDLKNTFRFIAFMSIPAGIKFFLINK